METLMPQQMRPPLYPGPCSYARDAERECICSASVVMRYQKRISGPLIDRTDIHVDVPRVNYE
jgi:magnesium chelatase family protein